MIITRQWLNEWIDVSKISSEKICKTLNEIGLEVDSLHHIKIPQNIVVAKVITCEKHPDADKLNVCQVDLGEQSVQIVCGAKNVRAGQFVAVSKVGATLPNGMEIKSTKLRGLESNGMICSAAELGLPNLEDGIMVLDESIGKLVLGKELSEYPLFNDDVIEIELTANRGDCLSIYGIARDLSVPFGLQIIEQTQIKEDENQLGIGRVLHVNAHEKVDASLLYKVIDQKELRTNLLIDLRLAFAGLYEADALVKLLQYASYATGVLLRAYALKCFAKEDKATIKIEKHKNTLDAIYGNKNTPLAFVGVSQDDTCKPHSDDKLIILEANYTPPATISLNNASANIQADKHLYRSSRGSEPELAFGMHYLVYILEQTSDLLVYAGEQEVIQDIEPTTITLNLDDLALMIGEEIEKNKIIKILQQLGFEVGFKNEQNVMHLKVPQSRKDILNIQDVCEEIVRMVGIDNIKSKPLAFSEAGRNNLAYENFKKRQALRHRAASVGFYEVLHFVFDDATRMERYGLKTLYKKRDLANPITNELNTLRTSLIPNLIESVARNVKFGKKSVRLFEAGTVFDKARDETAKIAFVFSGDCENENIANHGKPAIIDFFTFAKRVSNVVGVMELQNAEPQDNLSSPYEYAQILIEGKEVGFIARLHLSIQRELEIPATYICEIDLNALTCKQQVAQEYSKFQASTRDLSLMVDKDLRYSILQEHITSIAPKELIKFYPIDIYNSEEFGAKMSLTLKFHFQSHTRTLEEADINSSLEEILHSLQETFGINIR
ncbi:MAG: phenylalanine--tRNA ligase subunit beta [Sulfurospirillum sp.]|nr:phenylalanine--tRNA ligase subunit beta [Sulfurospirillum sp.]